MKNIYILFAIAFTLTNTLAAQLTTHNSKGYSIKYPNTWIIETGATNAYTSIIAPSDDAKDKWTENINITVNPITQYTPANYAAFSKTYLPKKIKKFIVLQEKAITQNGTTGYYLIFKGVQGKDALQWKQYYFIKNNMLYTITLTMEQAKYDLYNKLTASSLASFTVK